jgi:hypothetical protein
MSFVSPANLDHFVGVQAVINVRTSTLQSLPDWWRLGVGECRDGYLIFPASISGIGTGTTGACRNPWLGAGTGGGFYWYSETRDGVPTNPGWGQLKVAFARETETSLEFGQRYIAGVIALDPGPADPNAFPIPNSVLFERRGRQVQPEASAGIPVCAGCGLDACIVLNQVELYQTVGSPGGDIVMLRTEGIRQFVTWQGGEIGGNGCPASVPVRNTTWGAIKSNYR